MKTLLCGVPRDRRGTTFYCEARLIGILERVFAIGLLLPSNAYMVMRAIYRCVAVLVCCVAVSAWAGAAPFDLAGPQLEVKVTRGGKTLPIDEVPNLAAGDKIWVRADFPEAQGAHYLLVTAFLRGSTNPPPEKWFFAQETWKHRRENQGMTVTVPKGAEQVVVFLAPETGGDYRTLVNAVRGRPGAFVRASQDLNQAMLDRTRLDAYLAAIRRLNAESPAKLAAATPMLARSLGMKIDAACLQKIPVLQAACLTQGQNTMILSDGHSESVVQALTSGPAADLSAQLSYTPQASFGYYSAYVGSAMDLARILNSFRTAQYQYIPAMAAERGRDMALMLNTPPSFHNPKSVLVTALPAVEGSQPPPLHPVDSQQNYCAEKSSLVLAVDGAPLVFSTRYAHGTMLRLKTKSGKYVEEPLRADAEKGGLVLEGGNLKSGDFANTIDASLVGYWGFSKYQGPTFHLQNTHAQHWEVADADRDSLIVGRENTLHLTADDASCVDTILMKEPGGKAVKTKWKAAANGQLAVTVPLKDAKPGPLLLEVRQYGTLTAQTIPLHAFAAASRLQSFTVHAGDTQGVLRGSELAEVASLIFQGVTFTPKKTGSTPNNGLVLATADTKGAAKLTEGEAGKAKVMLADGRMLTVQASVDAPRPEATLMGKSVQPSASSAGSNIELSNPDEVPQDAMLRFSLHAQSPKTFRRDEQIEVATADDVFSTKLSLDNGGLTLENSTVALATLDPAKAFGSSAFGPLQFRVIVNGTAGDWQPLATLVRLPALQTLKCPAQPNQQCRLSGANLFLVDAVSSDAKFSDAVQVPDGFPGFALPVPHPQGGALYVKLRDDPSVVNQITLAAENLAAAPVATPRPAYNPNAPAPPPGAPVDAGGMQTPAGSSVGAAEAMTPQAGAAPASSGAQAQGNAQPGTGSGAAAGGAATGSTNGGGSANAGSASANVSGSAGARTPQAGGIMNPPGTANPAGTPQAGAKKEETGKKPGQSTASPGSNSPAAANKISPAQR